MGSIVALLLTGCFGGFENGGQSGTEFPVLCEETARTPVTDLDTPAEGLAFSPRDALDTITGDWTGSWTPVTGDPGDATASIAATEVVLVEQVLVTGGGGDDDVAEGAPAPTCASFYAIQADIALATADGMLAEAFVGEIGARDVGVAAFYVTMLPPDVNGSTAPASFEPADWDQTVLAINGAFSPGTLVGTADWQASNEEVAGDEVAGDEDTAESGSISVSGMTEGVGAYALERPE